MFDGSFGGTGGTIAPLRNVTLCWELLERVQNRPAHLPGLAVFYGPSGYGKTWSAAFGANKLRAHYLECGESWTKKHFLVQLLRELGVGIKRGTVPELVDAAKERLAILQRPLIIDEFDHVVARGYQETIRELHQHSNAPILVIGEELLPQKLVHTERWHNRVLDWVAAQPTDTDDAGALARLYAPGVDIAPDLLDAFVTKCSGRARRIVTNIERAREIAALDGVGTVDLAAWGERDIQTGQPPAPRV
jgi:hypothetical protein